jgi:hypothetical protein
VTATYQLIFKGEVIEGQHPAVVRKRLALALKLDDARIQTLFAGNAVVVRKSVDAETAAKFQAVFKKAGARLRVVQLAVSAETSTTKSAAESPDETGGGWEVLPPGTDLLEPEQRRVYPANSIDTSHLSLAKQLAFLPAGERYDPARIDAPELEIMPVGSSMGDHIEIEPVLVAADFDIAEPGAMLGVPRTPVDPRRVPDPDFDLAAPGERMSRPAPPPPPAPDVSHFKLE